MKGGWADYEVADPVDGRSRGGSGQDEGGECEDRAGKDASERVIETIDRRELRLAQTPQAFPSDVLRRAFDGEVGGASDCASLVEAQGGRVKVVEGDPRLMKITDARDLERAAALL